jgi:hypothetical protein
MPSSSDSLHRPGPFPAWWRSFPRAMKSSGWGEAVDLWITASFLGVPGRRSSSRSTTSRTRPRPSHRLTDRAASRWRRSRREGQTPLSALAAEAGRAVRAAAACGGPVSHSLGMLYSTFTAFLVPVNEGELQGHGPGCIRKLPVRGPGAQAHLSTWTGPSGSTRSFRISHHRGPLFHRVFSMRSASADPYDPIDLGHPEGKRSPTSRPASRRS